MNIGIMQPYFFPYVGTFALISSVDGFVFYDDVQHVRRGWINRNRILNRNDANGWEYINVPLRKAPREARIRDIEMFDEVDWREKLKRKLAFRYSKAPFFPEVSELIHSILAADLKKISDFNICSTKRICEYLGVKKEFFESSELEYDRSLDAQAKLIDITRLLKGTTYINAIGGRELYSEGDFERSGIRLMFIQMDEISYDQGEGDFVPNLSIIDVLMWNSPERAKGIVENYTLI